MKFDLAKTVAMLSVARMAVGAAAGNPADAAQAAEAVAPKGSIYSRKTAADLRRVAVFSGIVAAMKFASAPALAALPGCLALFMATFAVVLGYAVVLRKNPLDTGLFSSLAVTVLYGIGVAAVVCALTLAVGHPMEVSLFALGIKVAVDCLVYLAMCWLCDKVLKKCRRL